MDTEEVAVAMDVCNEMEGSYVLFVLPTTFDSRSLMVMVFLGWLADYLTLVQSLSGYVGSPDCPLIPQESVFSGTVVWPQWWFFAGQGDSGQQQPD